MSKFLFISVKPDYAFKIINGQKSIELRKSRPNVKKGDYVIIYATVPIKTVIGFGKIENIIETSPSKMWEDNSTKLGIDKVSFDRYYADFNKSIGIEISSICKFEIGFSLDMIKKTNPSFSPPQTYKYISHLQALRTFKSLS